MIYTQYGQTGLKVSRFGLGCMRFPRDEKEAIEMVRFAIDHGVNYLDTAYLYGDSEVITGKALRDGYRNKAYLATKCPLGRDIISKYEDLEKCLDEELMRLGTDHIDVYLLHGLDFGSWQKARKLDALTFLDKMIAKGKICHKAFSSHAPLVLFNEIVDAADFEMAQIQLNILDEYQQAGVEGLKYAAGKGMATVIMEPLRGGFLLNNVPAGVREVIDSYPEKRSLAEWCFRWLYNMPEISVILSGTSNLEQLQDNLRIFEQAEPEAMPEEERNLIARIRDAFEAQKSIQCGACRYCMPCPRGVGIPEIFNLYNNYQLVKPHAVDAYVYRKNLLSAGAGADQCVSCGLCMKHCPQGLKIPDLLKQVHQEFTEIFTAHARARGRDGR